MNYNTYSNNTDVVITLIIETTVICKFFVRLNFAFKIFVVKNVRQNWILKFFREDKLRCEKFSNEKFCQESQ